MSQSKTSNFVVMVVVVLVVLIAANLILGLGLGILSLALSLIGALLKLIFSKEILTLAAIGLVVYLIRRKRGKYSDHYPN